MCIRDRPATHRDHRTVLVKQLRHHVTVQYSKIVRRLVAELLNVWTQLWSSQVACKRISLVSLPGSTVQPCNANLNTRDFILFLTFIRRKYTRHGTGSASVCIRKKSYGSASSDWRVRGPHFSVVRSVVVVVVVCRVKKLSPSVECLWMNASFCCSRWKTCAHSQDASQTVRNGASFIALSSF